MGSSGAVCLDCGTEAKTGGRAGSWQDEDVKLALWRDSECNCKKNVEDSTASKEPRGRIERRFMD